jgi:hypothetical protein
MTNIRKRLISTGRSLLNLSKSGVKSTTSMSYRKTESKSVETDCFQQPELLSTLRQLDKIAPRFSVDPSAITVLHSPKEFYELLKVSVNVVFQHARF